MNQYKLANYSLSADLKRYAKAVGKEGNYTLGDCKVEFIEQGTTIFTPAPTFVNGNESLEKFDAHPNINMKGKFAIQATSERQLCNEQDKVEWLAFRDITLPKGVSSLDELIAKELAANKQKPTSENIDFTFDRLLRQANTPDAPSSTLAALILHTGQVLSEQLCNDRVKNLANNYSISTLQAQALAACVNGREILQSDNGEWVSKLGPFSEPANHTTMDGLVSKGLLLFQSLKENDRERYIATEQGKLAVRDNVL